MFIVHYSFFSLVIVCAFVCVCYVQVEDEDAGEESDDDNDVEEMLAKLNDITERFDALDESYQNALKLSEESRKVCT